MDRMLVTVFESERKAFDGKDALLDLDREGSISLYGYAIVSRKVDGSSTVRESDDDIPVGTLAGTALGALIGVLAGPVGAAVGAMAGLTGGLGVDVYNAGVGEDYVADVKRSLVPGTVALVAEVEEDWTAPVDTRMEAIGGVVFRRSISEVRDRIHQESVAAIKADIAQFKAERATAHADHKARLSEKINTLDTKLQHQIQDAKERREAADRVARVRAEFLSARAAVARDASV
jgi:uncharacterized membrane protein